MGGWVLFAFLNNSEASVTPDPPPVSVPAPVVYQGAVIGQLELSHYPQAIRLVAVPPELAATDFGSALPPRPYNRRKVTIDSSNLEPDAKWIDITAGTAPGGLVSATNRLARINHAGQPAHLVTLGPFGPSGIWNFEACSRDDKPSSGNCSASPTEFSLDVLTHPPDVPLLASGRRFDVSLAVGALSVTCTVPDD